MKSGLTFPSARVARSLALIVLSAACAIAARADYEWQWLSPTPTGDALTRLSFQNDRWIALGHAGTLLTSLDGTTWESHPAPSTFDLADIVYANGRYVLSDTQSGLYSSPDLEDWTTHTASIALPWTGTRSAFLAQGHGTFVRLQSDTSMYGVKQNQADVSPDGITWHQVQMPGNDYYPIGLAFFQDRFVAGYPFSGLYTSPDGETWTHLTFPTGYRYPVALAVGNGRLVVVFNEAGSLSSTDGATWVPAADATELDRVAFADGRFIARKKSDGTYLESEDGITWSPLASSTSPVNPLSVVHARDAYVALSTDPVSALLRSTDGRLWTSVQSRLDPAPAPGAAIAYGNGVFLAPGLRSTDGLHWSTDTFVPAGSSAQPTTLHFFRDRFFVTAGQQLYVSTDGRTGRPIFTLTDPAERIGLPLYVRGKYLLPATHGALSSIDGETWSRDPALTTLSADSAFGHDLFVRSDGTHLDTSPDGVTWTNRYSLPGASDLSGSYTRLGRPIYGNGTFVVLISWTNTHGHRGRYLLTSTDGLTWTQSSEYPSLTHTALTFVNDCFVSQTLPLDVAAGAPHANLPLPNPQFNLSYDGITWESYPMPTAASVTAFAGSPDFFLASTTTGLLFTSFPPPIPPTPAPISASDPPALKRGGSTRLVISATGTPPFSYQWRRDGVPLAAADLPSLVASEPGTYDVVITNAGGSVTSAPLVVTLDDAWLANVSSRAWVGTGEDVLIQGFVVRADRGDVSVLARAVGPALVPLGVSDVLANPFLELRRAGESTELAHNDNWADGDQASALTALFDRVGAFRLPAGAKDSALTIALPAGVYSFPVKGVLDGTGVALTELYDTSPLGRIVNLSARARVGSGDRTLIAGFVIAGGKPLRVLIRGVGPTLAKQGVVHPLANPIINLHRAGAVIHNNARWNDARNLADLRAATSAVGAFALDEGSNDAAMLETLPPGVYSVHLTSVDNTTGVALVEIYEVP